MPKSRNRKGHKNKVKARKQKQLNQARAQKKKILETLEQLKQDEQGYQVIKPEVSLTLPDASDSYQL